MIEGYGVEVFVLPFGPGRGFNPVGILLRRDDSQILYSAYAPRDTSAKRSEGMAMVTGWM